MAFTITPSSNCYGGAIALDERARMDGKIKFHEVSRVFPPMAEGDYQELKADIEANGLREPIVACGDRIIDGRHRYRACKELDIEPRFRQWDGRGSLLEFVLSINLHRRHLTTSQRALLAAELRPLFAREAHHRQGARTDLGAELRAGMTGKSSQHAARLVNVSARSVESAIAVQRQGTPRVIEAVKRGLIPISLAMPIAKLPAEKQDRIIALENKSQIRRAVNRSQRRLGKRTRNHAARSTEIVARVIAMLEAATEIIGDRDPRLVVKSLLEQISSGDAQTRQRLEQNLTSATLFIEVRDQRHIQRSARSA